MGKARSRLSYRQALEAVGWYFDRQQFRSIFVAEVDDGYVGKARPASQAAELYGQGFHFPHADVAELSATINPAVTPYENAPPLCPGGYSTFLAAVGEMYDRSDASYVSVLEVNDGFVIGYNAASKDGGKQEHRRRMLDRSGIDDLMDRVDI